MSTTRNRLRALLTACVKRGSFTLASGKHSDWYLDARLVTLSPEGSALAAELLLDMVRETGATAVCGLTLGADPLVTGVGILAHQAGLPLRLVYVRKQPKDHGTSKQVEGPPLSAEDRVLVLEDVVTSGSSALIAAGAVRREYGARIAGCAALLDRGEGGAAALAAAGIPLRAIFRPEDLL